jgi:hypothetical protein
MFAADLLPESCMKINEKLPMFESDKFMKSKPEREVAKMD